MVSSLSFLHLFAMAHLMAPSWWSLWWLRCWQGCMGGCLEGLNAPQQLWLQVSAAVFGNWHSAMLVDVRWFVQEDWFFQNLADMHWVAEWPPCTDWVTKSSQTEAGGGFGSAQRHGWLSGFVRHLAWHSGSLRIACGGKVENRERT